MPQTVKIKRRNASDDNAPGSLSQGELAYNEYQQVLRIGKDNGGAGQHVIAGQGSFVPWPGSTGFVVYNTARSGATPPTSINRSIVASAVNDRLGLAVVNGDGVSGNPTLGLAIDGLSLRAAVDANNDRVAVWDQSLDQNVYYTVNDIAGAASASNSFETWNTDVNGPIVADSATDTGTLQGANGIQTDGTAGTDTITIGLTATVTVPSTDAGAAAGPILILDRDSATSAADDVIGQLLFRGETASAGGNHDYAHIQTEIIDSSAASEDGRLIFSVSTAGAAPAEVVRMQDAEVKLLSGDGGATAGPLLVLDRNSATQTTSDVIGQITFRGETAAAGGDHDYAAIHVVVDDATAASEDGRIVFQTSAAGAALADTIQIESDGTLSTTNATYESLITADDDFITKKYFDDNQTGSQNLFQSIAGDTGTATADTTTDTITMVGGEGIVTTGQDTPDQVTFDLDIPNLTSLGAAPATGDQFVIYDITGTEHKEMTVGELFTSPAFTGNPTAPTAAQADNDTSIATTAFVRAVRLDQFAAPTSSVNINTQKLIGVAEGTSGTDAVNKNQLDNAVSGLDMKESVVCLSSSTSTEGTGYSYTATGGTSSRGQITWSTGPTTIDGVTLANDDRILNSEAGAASGIYVRTAQNTWDRATDFDEDAEVTANAYVFVEEGTNNADSGWTLTTNDPITIGGASGTSLTWAQFNGLGQVTAGNGLTKTGNTIDAVGTADRISVAADSIDIASTYVGQATITTLGTIGTGIWQGTAVGDDYGGTGQTTYAQGDILYASGVNTLAKLTVGSTDNFLTVTGGVPAWTGTVDGGTY